MVVDRRAAVICGLLLVLSGIATASESTGAPKTGTFAGEPPKDVGRRLLGSCSADETLFLNNCGNTYGHCLKDDDCCCSGEYYIAAGGCNFCCSPGYIGCDVPTYDDYYGKTLDYGCYYLACPDGSTQHQTTTSSSSNNRNSGSSSGSGSSGGSSSGSSGSSSSDSSWVDAGNGMYVNAQTGSVVGGNNPIPDWGK